MMKGAIEEGNKEISPMFPRLHVKDAEKGGPKAPPRNKMALYEQFSIPSPQSFASESSTSLFPFPLRSCNVPSISSRVGSNQSIQLCTSNAPSFLVEKIQDYNSRKISLTKLMKGSLFSSKNSLKAFDGEDDLITSGSANRKNLSHSLVENDKDEDKFADCNPSCSFKSLNAFRKKVNSLGTIELKSAQHGKNLTEEHSEVSQIGQKPEEVSACTLDSFGNTADASSISLAKGRNSKPIKKESKSLIEEIKCISADSLKTHKGSETFVDKIDLNDMEKLVVNGDHRSPDGLEIGERCFQEKRMRNKDEETYRHFDSLGMMDISPDDVLGVIGEKQFWKARRTIINQQRIFFYQVFELHRLIEVQRLIAGSPHLLLEDNSLPLNKTPLKPPTFKNLHSDYATEPRSPVVKLDSKSENVVTADHTKNNAAGKIPLPNCANNISKQVPSFVHHLGNPALAPLDINTTTKQPPSCVCHAPPSGNQWLVPVMSPSEGLVYKPIAGPCPPTPNAGFIPPLYGSCGAMSFNPGGKDIPDTTLFPGPHQKIGTLYGSPLPQFLPTLMHPSVSAPAFEQMGQSNGPENHHSPREVSSAIMYKSLSNVSCQTSQIRNTSTYHHHSPKDKELQRSTAATSPSKITKGNVLPLFPVAPTLWPSTDHRNSHADDNQPRVIKALPHNPKSATESAARIFRSIQEERKHL